MFPKPARCGGFENRVSFPTTAEAALLQGCLFRLLTQRVVPRGVRRPRPYAYE